MGDLSEHFNHKDFICHCQDCRGEEFKIHLGLVGALEQIASHFNKKVNILSGYWCDAYYESLKKDKRSFHNMGRAVHVNVDGVNLGEVFKFIEKIEGLNGIGFYPKEGYIHIDTRPKEKGAQWVKEGSDYNSLTAEKRRQYNL